MLIKLDNRYKRRTEKEHITIGNVGNGNTCCTVEYMYQETFPSDMIINHPNKEFIT